MTCYVLTGGTNEARLTLVGWRPLPVVRQCAYQTDKYTLRGLRLLLSAVAPCGSTKSFVREFGPDASASWDAVLSEPRGWGSECRQQAARLGLKLGDHVSSLARLDVPLIRAVVWRVTGAVDVVERPLTA